MKQFYVLLFALCAVVTVSHAQLAPGKVLLGPNLGVDGSSVKQENVTAPPSSGSASSFSLGVGVSAIKMKTSTVGWGLSLNYGLATNKYESFAYTADQKLANNTVTLGIFRRKYYPLGSKWNFYFDGGLNASYMSQKIQYPTNPDLKGNTYSGSLYLAPGMSYSLNKNLLLDIRVNNLIALTYYNSKTTQNFSSGTQKVNSSDFGFNSTLNSGNFLSNVAISLMWIL